MMPKNLIAEVITRINLITADEWNTLVGRNYPFLHHEFLWSMEESGTVGGRSGWDPCHMLIRDQSRDNLLVAVVPNYLKDNSYGEFVFDWSWANAYHQNGLNYYPKLITAMPFTPCVGPRICVREGEDTAEITRFCIDHLIVFAQQRNCSSWHILFPKTELVSELKKHPMLHQRWGYQYHWYNRDYQTFDDYLGAMKARKRNSVRKERRRVSEAGITFRHVHGRDLTPDELTDFYTFYHATYMKRGMRGYLNKHCFELLVEKLPDNTLFILAEKDGRRIAASMFFVGNDTIYGRYWGCLEEYKNLHFETSYYQGIEYCIAHGLAHIDAGAQGEHKIQRGFEPIPTYSFHWIAHPAFEAAIAEALADEKPYILEHMEAAAKYLPFKNNS